MESIPIESSQDWWWYKAKSNVLRYLVLSTCKSRPMEILEIGPGKGNNLETLAKFGKVDILEKDLTFIQHIKKNRSESLRNAYKEFSKILTKYDLIISLDVNEHIEDTKEFMNLVTGLLNEGGKVVISVPAYQALWSDHDVRLKHFRRYTWKMLYEELEDYKILKRQGFNFLLLPIRYLQIKFSKNIPTIKEGSSTLNSILYLISLIEHFLRRLKINPKFGISLFVVAQKKSNI